MNIPEEYKHCATEVRFLFEHIENGDMAPKQIAEEGKELCRKIIDLTPITSERGTLDEL